MHMCIYSNMNLRSRMESKNRRFCGPVNPIFFRTYKLSLVHLLLVHLLLVHLPLLFTRCIMLRKSASDLSKQSFFFWAWGPPCFVCDVESRFAIRKLCNDS